MQNNLVFRSLAEVECDALVCLVLDQEPKVQGAPAELDRATQGLISKLAAAGELTGKNYEQVPVFEPRGIKAKRLLLLGGGKAAGGRLGPFELRRLAGVAARSLKGRGVRSMALAMPPELAAEPAMIAAVTGVVGANFEPGKYRSEPKDERRIERLDLVFPPGREQDAPALRLALEAAEAIADAQNWSREVINEPSNRLTPTELARRAEEMARAAGLEIELIGEKRARELKMGAFLSVAQGSAEPPVMIVLRYRAGSNAAGRPVLGLVGKGITFDTGGISIKPADGMEKMKYDMAGGATMLGAMKAIAALKPALDVICIVPATENMPGGRAQKPGDVQIAMSGKSIEVINTDAEGRMVLADGLAYARQLGATHLVDAATLTGAVAVALGSVNVGVFANDERFYSDFARAQQAAAEKMWRLPLDDEYFEQIRGSVGDILNSGGRYGGAITAAMFLKEFAQETPWIHLDIAGTAWLDDNKPWMAKGPSAVALPTIVELALQMARDGSRE
jgi:leucyl aminopeptidase